MQIVGLPALGTRGGTSIVDLLDAADHSGPGDKFSIGAVRATQWEHEERALIRIAADRPGATIGRGHAENNLRDPTTALQREDAARTTHPDATIDAVGPGWDRRPAAPTPVTPCRQAAA